MRQIATLLAPLILIVSAQAADNDSDARTRARTVAPFIDGQTVLVAHMDLNRVDADALFRTIADAGKLDAGAIDPLKQHVKGWIEDLRKAGGKEIYLVLSLADLPEYGFLVVPVGAGADAPALTGLLQERSSTRRSGLLFSDSPVAVEKINGALVAGSARAVARVLASKGVPRPELAEAFAAAGDTAAQVLLLPTGDTRRVLEELFPTLPRELGGGPITTLTRGILWAALGMDLSPKPAVRLVVQSQDPATAEALSRLLPRIYQAAARGGVARRIPDFEKVTARLTPPASGDQLKLTLDVNMPGVGALLARLVSEAAQAASRSRTMNNFKQIALAMHIYHDNHQGFPAVASFKDGKPLLSWRVHILPFLHEGKLYKEFHLDEPWDSEHNKKLIARMPAVYRSSGLRLDLDGKTTCLATVGEAMIFTGGPKGINIRDVTDGTSNTIFFVDAADDRAVIWTRPDDLKVDLKHPQAGLVGHFDEGFIAALADGSVQFISKSEGEMNLPAMFTRNGGEVISSR